MRSGRPGGVRPSRGRGRERDRGRVAFARPAGRLRASGRRAAGPRTRPTVPRGGPHPSSRGSGAVGRPTGGCPARGLDRDRVPDRLPWSTARAASVGTTRLRGTRSAARAGRHTAMAVRPAERRRGRSPPARGARLPPAPPQRPDEHVGEDEERETEQEVRVPERGVAEEAAERGVVHRVRDRRVRVGPAARPARTRGAPCAPRCTTS